MLPSGKGRASCGWCRSMAKPTQAQIDLHKTMVEECRLIFGDKAARQLAARLAAKAVGLTVVSSK